MLFTLICFSCLFPPESWFFLNNVQRLLIKILEGIVLTSLLFNGWIKVDVRACVLIGAGVVVIWCRHCFANGLTFAIESRHWYLRRNLLLKSLLDSMHFLVFLTVLRKRKCISTPALRVRKLLVENVWFGLLGVHKWFLTYLHNFSRHNALGLIFAFSHCLVNFAFQWIILFLKQLITVFFLHFK